LKKINNFFGKFYWSINYKGTQNSKTFPKWQFLIWSAKVLVIFFLNAIFFRSTFLILPPQPLECKIFINMIKINFFINVAFLMKKIQDSSINSKKSSFLYYQNFMPLYQTYFILFVVKLWINWNKYCYSWWFLFNKIV
jgi:hypothetical protein